MQSGGQGFGCARSEGDPGSPGGGSVGAGVSVTIVCGGSFIVISVKRPFSPSSFKQLANFHHRSEPRLSLLNKLQKISSTV